jgi:hypothetical protein
MFARDPNAAAGYFCLVELVNTHSHHRENAAYLKLQMPSEETELSYLNYFNEGEILKKYLI